MFAAFDAGHRSGHQDGASSFHVRDRRPAHVEVTIEVGLHRAIEVLLGEVLEPLDVLPKRALLTRMSSFPNSSMVCSTAASRKRNSATSPVIVMQRRPSASTARLVVSASPCSSRYVIATSAPSRAWRTATARPIPESPPVISAITSRNLSEPRYCGASYIG